MRRIKLLILDDSIFMREFLDKGLAQDPGLEIVAKAIDPYDARDKIIQFRPDVMITDVHMSRMSGIDFTKKLLPQYYLPVIIISSDAQMERAAKVTGAVSFLKKPNASSPQERLRFLVRLITTIRSVANGEPIVSDADTVAGKVIAIGASTGGAEAIDTIIGMLPSVMPPIVIAQHMPPRFTTTFAERLNNHGLLSVREGEQGDVLLPGQVYVAQGGFHTTIVPREGRWAIALHPHHSGQGACPNIDRLLCSVAKTARGQAMGIILTGMGRDGAEGLLAMRNSGGYTLVQDEATSVVYGMPKAAYAAGASDTPLPVGRIADEMRLFAGIHHAGVAE
ncbi:chemotaxis-specific protein-glutamate methyltransferase CheB [Eubacteriales bacterium OttesenSCG-928-A19]|nr:chemotaxis-specific protein-glutamate methyltransferase CheB [Eubacteriales bacterium OttesenSCG-928-A19]